MAQVTIDSVSYEASEQVVQAVTKTQNELLDATKKADEAEAAKKKAEDELEAEKKENKEKMDSLQAKLDAANEKFGPDELDAMVNDRTAVVMAATQLVDSFESNGKSNEAIIKEVVLAKCQNVSEDSSAEYFKARFDMLSEKLSTDSQSNLNDHFRKTVTPTQDQDKEIDHRSPSQIARDKMMADSRNAWKGTKEDK